MGQDDNAKNKVGGLQSLLQEEYLKISSISDGSVIEGVIEQVTQDMVFVNVGYKSEGRVPLSEFDEVPSVGQTVRVYVVKRDGRGGLQLSKKKVDEKDSLTALYQALNDKIPVPGKFVSLIKNSEGKAAGYEVLIDGNFSAFCPLAKADITFVRNPQSLIGLEDYFMLEKVSGSQKNRSVVNRKAFLTTRVEENKKNFFSQASVGDVVEGKVKDITSFGAFVDLGGFDGLLHVNDLSWSKVRHIRDIVKPGDELQLKIIKIDQAKGEINLSLREMQENPWDTFSSRHNVDEIVKGKVVKIMDFGAFVEIEPGIEGLVHISELSWVKKVANPKEVLSVGQNIEVKILGWDLDARRISLGYKQTLQNPWEQVETKYPVGSKLKVTVQKVSQNGATVKVDDDIVAYLPSEEISWTQKVKDVREMYKEGDELDVMVIKIDSPNKKFRVSIKQNSEDPWAVIKANYPKYSVITGTVSKVEPFGVFVKVVGDIEGLISKQNLGNDENGNAKTIDSFKVGDQISAMVMDINPGAGKLALSISDIGKKEAESEYEKYMSSANDDKEGYTLGDILNKKNDE